ncbi:hypothetical protein SLA2020_258320 [Shorea laevis]
MIVTNTPASDLALTNLAYCLPTDHGGFGDPGSSLFLANVGDVFILSVSYPLSLFSSIPYKSNARGTRLLHSPANTPPFIGPHKVV